MGRSKWVGLIGICLSGVVTGVLAQPSYPSRPIQLIVPLGAGGATDNVARVLAERLSDRLGQPVVVVNRPGAEGIIGVDAAAKSPPDGYTLVLGSSTTMAANFYLRKQLPFDPQKDLVPVAMAVKNAFNVLVVNANVPASSLKEFIALAKARPGQLNYGTGSSGSKICVEMVKNQAGIDVTMVNYKSTPPSMTDLIGGQVQLVCEPLMSALPHIVSGKLKALGVTSPGRLPGAPSIPTVAESGLPGFEYSAWVGIFAPKGIAPAIIKRLSDEIAAVLKEPDTVRRIEQTNFDPMIGGPDQLADLLKAEMARAEAVIKASGIRPE